MNSTPDKDELRKRLNRVIYSENSIAQCMELGRDIPDDVLDRLIATVRRTPSPVADEAIVERAARAICKENGVDPDKLDAVGDPLWIAWKPSARAALQQVQPLIERVKERCASKAEEMGASYDTKENILLGIGALLRDAGSEIAAAIRQIEVKDVVGGGK